MKTPHADLVHAVLATAITTWLAGGQPLGAFDPGPAVGGVENTGWIDILTGISVRRRADAEYLVFVEEDYRAKVLLYRWKP